MVTQKRKCFSRFCVSSVSGTGHDLLDLGPQMRITFTMSSRIIRSQYTVYNVISNMPGNAWDKR